MNIGDRVVATLLAQLEGRWEEHERLLNSLGKEEADIGLGTLTQAAFFEAARRRFLKDGKPATDAEVVDFVATTREIGPEVADKIDPGIAERLINFTLGKLPMEANQDIDANVAFPIESLLLIKLIRDADYDTTELTEFIQRSKEIAEESFS